MGPRHKLLCLCSILPLIGAAPALSHHAASGLYDRDRSITIEGRIDSLFWRNPHVRFTLLAPTAAGGTETWRIEAGSVNSLERMGISEEVVRPGEFVAVTGLPGRGDEPIAYARSIVSADGERISLFFEIDALDEHYELERDPNVQVGSAATDIFRVWVPVRVPNTGSGRIEFPLTAAAAAARAAWNPANDPALRCVPPGMPAAMDNPYPIEFEDRGDEILLRLEEWDGVRTIHMDPEAASTSSASSPMGYSVGRWDGDSLVVDTSQIDYPYFDDLGTPQSDSIRVFERFDLDAERGRLHWTAEIVDPVSFTQTVRLEIEWVSIPGNERKSFDCANPD